jgi:3',5'-cyclic AMP phosphodiesterase CpdA
MGTCTWLHISDIHFRTAQTFDTNIVLQALLRDVGERMQEDNLHPDFIVVTGDVADTGHADEYKLARQFFDALLARVSLSRERLFIIPGNHDVDRRLISQGAHIIGNSLADRSSTHAILTTPDNCRIMFDRFAGYAAFINDYLSGFLRFDDEQYFYVRTLEVAGRRLAVLGLNSAWVCASNEDQGRRILLGECQVRAALEQAHEAEIKMALLHHPFDWLREFDRQDSEALLLDRCHFVLHGHLHRMGLTQLLSPDSGVMVIAGGACYDTREHPNLYNFVQLDFAAGTGTMYLRRYSNASGGFWAKDTLTYRNVPDGVYTFALSHL